MAVRFMDSERLWYRAPELGDAPRLQRLVNDPRVRRTVMRAFPLTLEPEEEWIRSAAIGHGLQAPPAVSLVFGLRGESVLIGSTGLFGINWICREAEWGILVDPEHWNRGYGREVARSCLRYAFVELNLQRVGLRVHSNNEAGLRSYTAAGFVREGLSRRAVYAEGEYHDVIHMAVLRDEWEAVSAPAAG